MSGKRRSAQRRDGRCSSFEKTEQPAGTCTWSVTGPASTRLTCRMLSQYSRAADAPVDARPPVAALGAVALVAEPAHQPRPGAGDPLDAQPGRSGLSLNP
jgi:hypothetical protein